MGRQKVRIDQLVVPPGTPDGYRPAVNLGELAYEAPGAGGGVASVVAGTGIAVDSTDPANPIVSATGTGGGGGSSVRSVDNPADPSWGTASAYDVEFDTDGTTLPAGWSWVNQGTSTWEQKFGAGIITQQTAAPRIIARALPTEATWTATAKVSQTAPPVNWSRVGLCLRDSVADKLTQFTFTSSSASGWNGRNAAVNDWNGSSFFGNEVKNAGITHAQYLRIKKNSGNTYDFQFSNDGIAWQTLVSAKVPYSTYNQIGFTCASDTTPPPVIPGVIHWFRVR